MARKRRPNSERIKAPDHEYTSLALHEPETNEMRVMALDFPQGKGLIHEEMVVPLDGSIAGKAFRNRQPVVLDRAAMDEFSSPISRLMRDDEEGTHERVKAHRRELIDPKISEHRGRIVKSTGDGLLADLPAMASQ